MIKNTTILKWTYYNNFLKKNKKIDIYNYIKFNKNYNIILNDSNEIIDKIINLYYDNDNNNYLIKEILFNIVYLSIINNIIKIKYKNLILYIIEKSNNNKSLKKNILYVYIIDLIFIYNKNLDQDRIDILKKICNTNINYLNYIKIILSNINEYHNTSKEFKILNISQILNTKKSKYFSQLISDKYKYKISFYILYLIIIYITLFLLDNLKLFIIAYLKLILKLFNEYSTHNLFKKKDFENIQEIIEIKEIINIKNIMDSYIQELYKAEYSEITLKECHNQFISYKDNILQKLYDINNYKIIDSIDSINIVDKYNKKVSFEKNHSYGKRNFQILPNLYVISNAEYRKEFNIYLSALFYNMKYFLSCYINKYNEFIEYFNINIYKEYVSFFNYNDKKISEDANKITNSLNKHNNTILYFKKDIIKFIETRSEFYNCNKYNNNKTNNSIFEIKVYHNKEFKKYMLYDDNDIYDSISLNKINKEYLHLNNTYEYYLNENNGLKDNLIKLKKEYKIKVLKNKLSKLLETKLSKYRQNIKK